MGSSNSDEDIAKRYFYGEIGKSTLVNKLDIKNQIELEEAEAYYVELAIANGLSKQAQELSPDGLKQMHKELFGEIYEWAGVYRTYGTGRGLPFCRPEFIDNELKKLYQRLNNKLYHGMTKDEFIRVVAYFLGYLNAIHPFIDGNGRTQRQSLLLICQQFDFTLKINQYLTQKYWYRSAELSHQYGDDSGFEEILKNIID